MSGEARIFHYTVGSCYFRIYQDRGILPETVSVPDGERPAVWFSTHRMWEETANKGGWDEHTGEVVRLTRDETAKRGGGLVRIEVAAATAPHRWKDYLRLSGVPLAHARGLERAAREWGANVYQWRVTFDPVPMHQWLTVEVFSATAWEPLADGNPVSWLAGDTRFAFIACSAEEWSSFRDAPIVAARDRQTGATVVVFGLDKVQQLAESGAEAVQAMVVEIDPDTNQLERVAAACLIAKGRCDLDST